MSLATHKKTGHDYSASSMYFDAYQENPGYFDSVDISPSAMKAIEDEAENTLLWLVSREGDEKLLTEQEFKTQFNV